MIISTHVSTELAIICEIDTLASELIRSSRRQIFIFWPKKQDNGEYLFLILKFNYSNYIMYLQGQLGVHNVPVGSEFIYCQVL